MSKFTKARLYKVEFSTIIWHEVMRKPLGKCNKILDKIRPYLRLIKAIRKIA